MGTHIQLTNASDSYENISFRGDTFGTCDAPFPRTKFLYENT